MDQGKRIEFFIELAKIQEKISELVEKYDFSDEFMGISCYGLINDDGDESGRHSVEAMCSHSVDNEEELAIMLQHISENYYYNEDDTSNPDFWINFGDSSIN
jgi:hypothetical protein